jgi:peptidoglycan/xylan/chitin deacetylase (PgdA/CDA1 family)
MLHRIGPTEPDRIPCIAELNVSVERLQRFVDDMKGKYDFVSIDEVKQRMFDKSLRKRPFLCFTFDDGFRDNLTYGLPFFEKNNIPFAVFLTVDFIKRHPAFNYPFILERIVANNDFLEIDGNRYDCQTTEQKNVVYTKLKWMVLGWKYDNFEDKFKEVLGNKLVNHDEYFEDLTMDWTEVAKMAQSSLCTIGSHTMTHRRLSNLSRTELEFELGESKRQIEDNIGKEVKYVSYPFGWTTDVNEMVFDVAKDVGYEMGFVSHGGGVRKKDCCLFGIKREMLKF